MPAHNCNTTEFNFHTLTHAQDRHFKKNGHPEPAVDPSQDYTLLLGYENATHTVLRFRRRLDACHDTVHDVAITGDTQSLFYMLHADEPLAGSVTPGALPDPRAALSAVVPLQLMQRTDDGGDTQHRRSHQRPGHEHGHRAAGEQPAVVDLRNGDVTLPMHGETLHWCRVFELAQFAGKHHIVRFEPIFDAPASRQLMDEIVLYECQGDAERLRTLAAQRNGQLCVSQRVRATLPCAAIVAAWRSGSTVSRFILFVFLVKDHLSMGVSPAMNAFVSAEKEAEKTNDSNARKSESNQRTAQFCSLRTNTLCCRGRLKVSSHILRKRMLGQLITFFLSSC